MSRFLQVEGLTRRFGGLVAVNAVTLDLHVGEVHALNLFARSIAGNSSRVIASEASGRRSKPSFSDAPMAGPRATAFAAKPTRSQSWKITASSSARCSWPATEC